MTRRRILLGALLAVVIVAAGLAVAGYVVCRRQPPPLAGAAGETVRGGVQAQLNGLTVGIISLRPGGAGAEVMLGVFDPERKAPVSFRLRRGDHATVAGRTLRVLAIGAGSPGSVTLAARGT